VCLPLVRPSHRQPSVANPPHSRPKKSNMYANICARELCARAILEGLAAIRFGVSRFLSLALGYCRGRICRPAALGIMHGAEQWVSVR
jgi:hypothetical protein